MTYAAVTKKKKIRLSVNTTLAELRLVENFVLIRQATPRPNATLDETGEPFRRFALCVRPISR